MDRVNVGGGVWFDRDSATRYGEKTRWDGSNHISEATGSQWEHEELYRSRRGAWYRYSWSQWQGSRPSWETLSEADAHAWLIAQGHEDAVPEAALAAAEG